MNQTPLPWDAFKYCPKCGSEMFRRQETNAMKCEICSYHHFFNSAGAVIAIIHNDKGEVLVTERAFMPYKGMLDLPGGFIMPDETAEDAVKRELFEELKVEVNGINYLYTRSNRYPFSDVIVFTMDLIFEVSVKDLSCIVPGDDVLSYRFVRKDEINGKLFGITSVREVIEQYMKDN